MGAKVTFVPTDQLDRSDAQREFLLYLDHTYLDLFVKGRITSLPREKAGTRLVVVYSDETLREIERSTGVETAFLDVLARLEARYLVPHVAGGRFADSADLLSVDPHAEYQEFHDSRIDVGGADVLLLRVAQALSGVRPDLRVQDLLADVKRHGRGMADEPVERAKQLEDLPHDLRDQLHGMRRLLEEIEASTLSADFSQPASVKEVDRHRVGGPLRLNNIRPPKVVEQIWERLPQAVKEKTSIEAYFGIEQKGDTPMSLADKARWVFSVLDSVGYYRDRKLKTDSKVDSLLSDMGHAAFASYCHAFATLDERLARKASAAYEFVGCPTKVLPWDWPAGRKSGRAAKEER